MLEANCDIVFGSHPCVVTIKFPPTWGDAVTLLKRDLAQKRVTQAYVKMGKPRKPRTTGKHSQNAHFNAHVQQMAQEWGDSFDEVKMHIKKEAISMGYPYHTTSFGDVVPESEANASTVECGYLIDTAHRIASDMGIKLREM